MRRVWSGCHRRIFHRSTKEFACLPLPVVSNLRRDVGCPRTTTRGLMSRVSLAERAKLSALLLRGGLRRLGNRLTSSPLLRWRFVPGKTDRLIIAPQDLRTADATRAAEIYAGRFTFAGKVVICDSRSPFEIIPPSDEWAAGLLGFGWLRHLRAADSGITRANARSLVDEW